MPSSLVPEKSIQFSNNNHAGGIISYIKEQSGITNIVERGVITISVSSMHELSKDPGLLFQENANYFSTTLEINISRFIIIDFKEYSPALDGVSIYTDSIDWFDEYHIESSDDLLNIKSYTIFHCNSFPQLSWQHFYFEKTKPSRYINISVNLNQKSHSEKLNFAIYQIEFFGDLYHTHNILHNLLTCEKGFKLVNVNYFASIFIMGI